MKRGLGGSALLRLGTIHRSFWGGRGYLCAFSGSAVSSVYATWAVPAWLVVPCGHHLWGTEKYDRCVKTHSNKEDAQRKKTHR